MKVLLFVCVVGAGVGEIIVLCRRGGWRAVLGFALTAVVAVLVGLVAIVPIDNGIRIVDVLSLAPFGFVYRPLLAVVPAVAWRVVWRVCPCDSQATKLYGVIYCGLIGVCSLPCGLIAVGLSFPDVTRRVLARLSRALPE